MFYTPTGNGLKNTKKAGVVEHSCTPFIWEAEVEDHNASLSYAVRRCFQRKGGSGERRDWGGSPFPAVLQAAFLTDHVELNLVLVFFMSLDVESWDLFLKFLGIFCPTFRDAGDGTQGLAHDRVVICHWTTLQLLFPLTGNSRDHRASLSVWAGSLQWLKSCNQEREGLGKLCAIL